MAKQLKPTAMVTGIVRFSYVNVFTPKAFNENDTPKYNVSILIPKSDTETIQMVKSCIQQALQEGIGKLGGSIPKVWKDPLRDGDTDGPDDEAYEGHYFLNASSTRAPGAVKKVAGKAVKMDEDEFYSGCYGLASINFYAFNVKNKGIACGLNNIMKTDDGERLGGGGASAAEDFGLEESEGEDFL